MTAKHFPGHAALADDPAAAIATLDTTVEELNEVDLRPFRVAIACGVRAIMLGPAVVMAIDPARPASRSPRVVRLLREGLAFRGAIVTDDLDARSITADGDVASAAVDALAAGADLLLVGEEHAGECALAVADAAAAGSLEVGRLRDAVSHVRGVARPSGLQREA